MDDQRFDQLSRHFATFRTRRQAVRAIAGAVVATVVGVRSTAAQDCADLYSPCPSDDACCADAVCQFGLCMPGCLIDGIFVNAWASPPGDICQQCLPALSTAEWSPANEGMSCWSGDSTAGATFCQSGECRSTGPAQCPPPPPCYTDQLIDPATCTYAVAEAGTACGGQPMCHGGFFQPADNCDGAGFCIGGGSRTVPCAPYVCGESACTTSCVTDGNCAAGALCCGDQCTILGTVDNCGGCGDACPENTVCDGGVCVSLCLELGDACETAEQCCAEGQTCGVRYDDIFATGLPRPARLSGTGSPPVARPIARLSGGSLVPDLSSSPTIAPNDPECCLELGAAGCTGPGPGGCCANVVPGLIRVSCGNSICGGAGAACEPSFGEITCASGTCCTHDDLTSSCCAEHEACVAGECVSTCLELLEECETADQCCGAGQTCAPYDRAWVDQCCLELGASGCTGTGTGNCCTHAGETGPAMVLCGNGICGGPGAACLPGGCASGLCCGQPGARFCCADNEACIDNACVPE